MGEHIIRDDRIIALLMNLAKTRRNRGFSEEEASTVVAEYNKHLSMNYLWEQGLAGQVGIDVVSGEVVFRWEETDA